MTIPSGTNLGRYEIRSKIGAGGMGGVYLAEDAQLRRRVALKILPGNLASNQDRMRRFIQEARAAAEVHVGLGDKDQAFVWLEKAFEARSGMLKDVTYEQYYNLLRDDPRYRPGKTHGTAAVRNAKK